MIQEKQFRSACNVSGKVMQVFLKRAQLATNRYWKALREQMERPALTPMELLVRPWERSREWWDYVVDLAQRSILYWDTLRERGDQFLAHESAGKPPVLHFDYEFILDAREFERPVNYALVRIIPPAGVVVDPTRRPYVIIDPRAGHGPGIGGFKDDSQVGVALRAGHPVYFVIFFPDPEPGQTLSDVCRAEAAFVRRVRELHPQSPKPVIVGNCQGGWAAMMLASANPDEAGAIVINGAPMSYWGGAWRDGEGDNPMRYAGGLLGGTWLASLAGDLGDGKFDGANLVQNMENLNPANTFWDKYYHLFANVDTERPRFLEFERWWGGFYLLNREEIDWITQNLFVGNRLWKSGEKSGGLFDLKSIRSPIILFASLGDNITPPQQAFNWVADVYGSTEEIKARGQVIVGLLHEDIGHLGIFVSGRVAKKEHTQIVSVLESIEALPPGLYGMKIVAQTATGDQTTYTVAFVEQRLEEVVARLNRLQRADEKPFAAAAMVSEFNQRAYDLFVSPLIRTYSSDTWAKMARQFHPLRMQRWMWSSVNPSLAWLKPVADFVRERRRPVAPDQSLRKAERAGSDWLSATLDFHRDIRDALSEAMFFSLYGNLFVMYTDQSPEAQREEAKKVRDENQAQVVREALETLEVGGYPEALARAGALLAWKGESLPLSRVQMKKEVLSDYADLLPDLSPDAVRRIRGVQDVIVAHHRDRAIETLPRLLGKQEDRQRFLKLLDRLPADPRVQEAGVTAEQQATLACIRHVLAAQSPEQASAESSARAASAQASR